MEKQNINSTSLAWGSSGGTVEIGSSNLGSTTGASLPSWEKLLSQIPLKMDEYEP